eukprot:9248414-Pyramimonas_sp.AAC.1
MVDCASSRTLILTPWSVLQMVLLTVAHPSSRSARHCSASGARHVPPRVRGVIDLLDLAKPC